VRRTRADVVQLVVDHGAPHDVARAIADALARAGLSPDASRQWLAHPTRAYAVVTGRLSIGGFEYPRKQTPVFAIDDGHAEKVLAAATRFAEASEDERFIALWFGGELDDVRRMTGADATRASAIRAVGERLRAVLRKREHVCDVARTVLPGRDGTRIVDLLVDGHETAVLDDLVAGRVDPRALLAAGELHFHGW
jgi:hypothetical protein